MVSFLDMEVKVLRMGEKLPVLRYFVNEYSFETIWHEMCDSRELYARHPCPSHFLARLTSPVSLKDTFMT